MRKCRIKMGAKYLFAIRILAAIHTCMCQSDENTWIELGSGESETALPLALELANKIYSGESSEFGSGENKVLPVSVSRVSHKNILEILNSEEVKGFLQQLPLDVLKQLNVMLDSDEHNGYCYLIKLFKFYNKDWKNRPMPENNCVIKDDEIFGQYLFDSQKVKKKLKGSDISIKEVADKTSASSNQISVSDQIELNRMKYPRRTTMKPAELYFTSTSQRPAYNPELANPEKKFKLYLNHQAQSTLNFKQPPFENGSFTPSAFPRPPKDLPYLTSAPRVNSILHKHNTYPEPQHQQLNQVNHGPQKVWMQAVGYQPNQVPSSIHILKPNVVSTPIQQFKVAQNDNIFSDHSMKHRGFSSNTNQNLQQLASSYSHQGAVAAVDQLPIYSAHSIPGTAKPNYANPQIDYVEAVVVPHSPPDPHGHTQVYGYSHENAYAHAHGHPHSHAHAHRHSHSHSPVHHHPHYPQSFKSWLGDKFSYLLYGGTHYGNGPTKTLLDWSITVLPFLAFGSYILILLFQALYPLVSTVSRTGSPSNNSTMMMATMGRSFYTNSTPIVIGGPDKMMRDDLRVVLSSTDDVGNIYG